MDGILFVTGDNGINLSDISINALPLFISEAPLKYDLLHYYPGAPELFPAYYSRDIIEPLFLNLVDNAGRVAVTFSEDSFYTENQIQLMAGYFSNAIVVRTPETHDIWLTLSDLSIETNGALTEKNNTQMQKIIIGMYNGKPDRVRRWDYMCDPLGVYQMRRKTAYSILTNPDEIISLNNKTDTQ